MTAADQLQEALLALDAATLLDRRRRRVAVVRIVDAIEALIGEALDARRPPPPAGVA